MSADDFDAPNGVFLLGDESGVPIAMGGWRRCDDNRSWADQTAHGRSATSSATAEIKRMYVVPARRGAGLARDMLTRLEEVAVSAGIDRLILATGLAQPHAISLYASAGYTPTASFGHYADEPDAVHLAKELAP